MTSKLSNDLTNGAPKMNRNKVNKNTLKVIPDQAYNKYMENWIKSWHDCIDPKGLVLKYVEILIFVIPDQMYYYIL